MLTIANDKMETRLKVLHTTTYATAVCTSWQVNPFNSFVFKKYTKSSIDHEVLTGSACVRRSRYARVYLQISVNQAFNVRDIK